MSMVRPTVCLSLRWLLALAPGAVAQPDSQGQFKAEFLRLCDVASAEINNPARQTPKPVPFYIDSYAVRALCVAHDMTGTELYLETCKRWTDRMIEYQGGMTPKGAYYMNYGRKPGENEGEWFVADSSSIALAILATSARCGGPEKQKYLDSVEQFASLVAENYIGEAGGVTDGFWSKYAGEWWCSSGIFGSVAFLMHRATGSEQYREIGRNAINWLNHLDLSKVKFGYWKTDAPMVVMYVLEAYSAGMPYIEPGTQLYQETLDKVNHLLAWMSENQGTSGKWDYNKWGGSKLGGLPFHMYVLSAYVPQRRQQIRDAADAELRHIASVLAKDNPPKQTPLAVFAMLSYAERLSPGAIYRQSAATRPS